MASKTRCTDSLELISIPIAVQVIFVFRDQFRIEFLRSHKKTAKTFSAIMHKVSVIIYYLSIPPVALSCDKLALSFRMMYSYEVIY